MLKLSVVEAVKQGRREALEALRDVLAAEIDAGPETKDLAPLVLRLEKVLAELDGVKPVVQGGISWDERLEARRKARKTAPN